MIQEITLDREYIVTDGGTSDGTQIKYYKNGAWYKEDRYGGEGEAEELASEILRLSGFDKNKYVIYKRMMINGIPGCKSKNFLNKNEQFITLYRLHMNVTGRDPATVTSMMDYDDAIEYMLKFVLDNTGLDIHAYLADTFVLDEVIQNTDRHFNNLGVIYNGDNFRVAPIFDNGKSFGVGLKAGDTAFAKAFSGEFSLNRKYLHEYATLKINFDEIMKFIRKKGVSEHVLRTLNERKYDY